MAYITNYTYNLLVERIKSNYDYFIDKAFFRKNIYDNEYLYYMFNQLDLKKFIGEKIALTENNDGYIVYKNVPDREDNLKYVYEKKGSVKYHQDSKCESLKSGFKDFKIPESIQRVEETNTEKFKELVETIRKWFRENDYTTERYLRNEINDKTLTRAFNRKFPKEFGIDEITISDSDRNQFVWYKDVPSSGNFFSPEMFDYDKFIIDIAELLERRYNLCTGYAWRTISKYDYLHKKTDDEIMKTLYERQKKGKLGNVKDAFITNIGVERIRNFLKQHREIKDKAIDHLSNYLKWSYNFDQNSFSKVFLEDFNLKPCMICHAEELHI